MEIFSNNCVLHKSHFKKRYRSCALESQVLDPSVYTNIPKQQVTIGDRFGIPMSYRSFRKFNCSIDSGHRDPGFHFHISKNQDLSKRILNISKLKCV